ncbi:ferredoxin [Pseudooctadecabacter jejudonensis]|uniref:4Fe-4S ferredoxin-type domain-containing protein n=1 Tax=Pseudooctadecabacter jejudonensis TaxID=1391910 RepID=A0A1Y5RZM5_9RHOB|nr:ferredoxin [Pseudooctadecabacter jejudonensis]SLN27843.1 hypothetical protein PSJ8397_01152 [Pseudooctadecabacter jejudonensis]
MTLDDIATAAAEWQLTPLGALYEAGQTIVLLGPKEPGFWRFVTQSAAFTSAKADPLDSWSTKAITALATQTGSVAVFPFGGPPFHPFITWALRSGAAWQSPVGLLVHPDAGLLVSYRGALVFEGALALPPAGTRPCDTCAGQPCRTACPVTALDGQSYDVPKCKAHIDVSPTCQAACQVRMACPISQSYGRDPAQTAYHMKVFHSP